MENGELNLIALAQHFSDEDKARQFVEKLRWPDGPVCPKCGEVNNAYRLEPKPSKKGTHVRKGVRIATSRSTSGSSLTICSVPARRA